MPPKVKVVVQQNGPEVLGRRVQYIVVKVRGATKPRIGWVLSEKELNTLIGEGKEVIVVPPRTNTPETN